MDGLACLDEIHKRFPEIKVVMLSASTSPDLVEAALRRGASAYISKSVDPTDLPSTLRQAIEGNVFSATARLRRHRADGREGRRADRARDVDPEGPRARPLQRRDRARSCGSPSRR